MALKLSKRSDIESFRALENLRAVNELVKVGENIIRLEAGQPCFGSPQAVLKSAQEYILQYPLQGYTESMGTITLRQKLVDYYKSYYNVNIDPSQICITAGSSAGFILAFIAAFDAGDTVGLITPTYAAYRNILKSLDLNIVEIEADPDNDYKLTADLLEKCDKKLDGLIINSPSNPTGSMIDAAELKKICEWCEANGTRLISDEAYHRITYENKAHSVLEYSDKAIVLNTFSKYFAMTGWRLGWLVVPEDMAPQIKKLAENLYVSPPTVSQFVATECFEHTDILDSYVELYHKNRDILKHGLPEAGLEKLSPGNGAFYLYADVSRYTNDSEAFAKRALEEAKVSFSSGVDFDAARGRQAIRISYAGTSEDMIEACQRIKEWLA